MHAAEVRVDLRPGESVDGLAAHMDAMDTGVWLALQFKGRRYVLLLEEDIACLEQLFSDPDFRASLAAGKADLATGRVDVLGSGERPLTEKQMAELALRNDDFATSVECGLKDLKEGRVRVFGKGERPVQPPAKTDRRTNTPAENRPPVPSNSSARARVGGKPSPG